MSALQAIYLDFSDPASHRAWRWLSLLPERETVEIRPYSMDREDGEPVDPWERTEPSWALELLALGEVAREEGGRCHRAYVDAVFRAVHVRGKNPSAPETWLALGAESGVDFSRFIDDGERWRAEVGLWHREAEDELGIDGTPALLFDDERVLHVVLEKDVMDPEAARRLLEGLSELAEQPVAAVRRQA